MTTMPLAEARANLSRVVDEAVRTQERTEITRKGKRAAVLLSAEDYDSILETMDILSDATLVAEVWASLEELTAGDVLTTEQLLDSLAGRSENGQDGLSRGSCRKSG